MTTFLMFHELGEPGRAPADDQPGYLRYVVPADVFARRLRWMVSQGLRGISAGQWHSSPAAGTGQVVITFDDGCETDRLLAAPLLADVGFSATFYVVSGWLGHRRGFMTRQQLRELHAAGFEIGSHSTTHAFLSDVSRDALRLEIDGSKRELEDIIGAPVRHMSCPGGRWNRTVAAMARDAGYETLPTSRLSPNDGATDAFALGRCAVMQSTSDDAFESLCRATGWRRRRMQQQMVDGARWVLGNRVYGELRRLALKHT